MMKKKDKKEIDESLRRLAQAVVESPRIVLMALDILEAREEAACTLKPIVERRTPRKHTISGKKKCKICGARIRGNVKNHNEGEYHQKALKGKS
jgi:hypothetical protein